MEESVKEMPPGYWEELGVLGRGNIWGEKKYPLQAEKAEVMMGVWEGLCPLLGSPRLAPSRRRLLGSSPWGSASLV